MTSIPFNHKEANTTSILELVADIAGRKLTKAESSTLNESLEQLLTEHTRELAKANEFLRAEIARRNEAENALRVSERRYRTLFENSPVPMWELDCSYHRRYLDDLKKQGVKDFRTYFDGHPEDVMKLALSVKFVDMNKAALELFGIERLADFMNVNKAISQEESVNVFKENSIGLANGETRFENEVTHFNVKGERKHIILSANCLPESERVLSSAIDITERKEAENEARYLKEYLETILESLDVCVRVMEPKQNVEYENLLLKSSFGYGLGKPCYTMWGKDKPCENCSCEAAIQGNKVHRREEALSDGRIYAIASVPLKTRDKRQVAVEMIYDITSIKRSEYEIRSLAERILSVQEDERKRISRELHDEAGQWLTAIKVNLKLIENILMKDDKDTKKLITETKDMVEQTMDDLRKLSLDLRPETLDTMGLAAAIESYTEKFEERTGINVLVENGLEMRRFPQEMEISLFRILQESLTNAAKYSKARNVMVKLFEDKDELVMSVQDDGCGFDLDKFWKANTQIRSLGLIGMRERAILLRGELIINSEPGKGTGIFARIPHERNTKLQAPNNK